MLERGGLNCGVALYLVEESGLVDRFFFFCHGHACIYPHAHAHARVYIYCARVCHTLIFSSFLFCLSFFLDSCWNALALAFTPLPPFNGFVSTTALFFHGVLWSWHACLGGYCSLDASHPPV